jgi:hypothetical protein
MSLFEIWIGSEIWDPVKNLSRILDPGVIKPRILIRNTNLCHVLPLNLVCLPIGQRLNTNNSSCHEDVVQENCNVEGTGGAARGQVTDAICAQFTTCTDVNAENRYSSFSGTLL